MNSAYMITSSKRALVADSLAFLRFPGFSRPRGLSRSIFFRFWEVRILFFVFFYFFYFCFCFVYDISFVVDFQPNFSSFRRFHFCQPENVFFFFFIFIFSYSSTSKIHIKQILPPTGLQLVDFFFPLLLLFFYIYIHDISYFSTQSNFHP